MKAQSFLYLSLFLAQASYAGTLDGAASASGNNVAIGANGAATGTNATSVGENSFARGDSSSSYGTASDATEINSTAIGAAALADANSSTALGTSAWASGERSLALGAVAMVEFDMFDSIAIGADSYAGGSEALALGTEANALANRAHAIGVNSTAAATNSVAIGYQAETTEAATNSVALGNGSVADSANTVSVGNAGTGLTRRITNVAPAVYGTDAVNFDQFNIGLGDVRKDAFAGVAAAAAFVPAMPSASGKTAVSLGAASYRGQNALSFSLQRAVRNSHHNTQLMGGVAYDSSGHSLGRVGASWEW